MSYPFPPPAPPELGPWVFAGIVGCLFIAFARTLTAFRTADRPRWHFVIRSWGLGFVLVAAVCAYGLSSVEVRAYLPVYSFLVLLLAGLVTLLILARKSRVDESTVRFGGGWLVAIGVVVVLCLTPFVSIGKQTGRATYCKRNLWVLGLVFQQSQDQFGGRHVSLAEGNPSVSWRVLVYSKDDRSGPAIDPHRPWNDPVNLEIGREFPHYFDCPANFHPKDEMGRYYTAYAGVSGPESAFPNGHARPIKDFTDGASNTIIYGEAAGLKIVWTEPRDIDISREPIGINLPGNKRGKSPGTLSSYHPGGATVVFADGKVRFLSQQIHPAVLKALLTATGGEELSDADY